MLDFFLEAANLNHAKIISFYLGCFKFFTQACYYISNAQKNQNTVLFLISGVLERRFSIATHHYFTCWKHLYCPWFGIQNLSAAVDSSDSASADAWHKPWTTSDWKIVDCHSEVCFLMHFVDPAMFSSEFWSLCNTYKKPWSLILIKSLLSKKLISN